MTDGPGGRRLVLLRHAKAEPAGTVDDALRPLTLLGRRQATAVGSWLGRSGFAPRYVLVSPAVRAGQTWELLRPGLADPPEDVRVEDALYGAGVHDLQAILRELSPPARSVLVVGHEPTLSGTAEALAGEGDAAHLAQVRAGLPTAACAVLELSGAWSAVGPGTARLLDVVRAAA